MRPILLLPALLMACEGPEGVPGSDGTNGVDGVDGTNGTDGTDGVDGADGADGSDGADGTDGNDGEGYFPLEAAGVVGVVTDRSGETVSGGTVYFVPAADVAALPATTIAVSSTDDEPLEDVIAAGGASFTKATVGANGRYVVPTLPVGDYFVTFVPDAADTGHLPGGSLCRVATASTDLVGTRQDFQVSSAAPADAEYVGTGRCVTCHGTVHIAETMHRIGIWSPYEMGPLQNTNPRAAELYTALTNKFETPTTVYFYGYDATRGMDKYRTSESNPGTGVSFSVTLRETLGQYEMVLHNIATPSDPDRVLNVDTVYGGGVNKQRYMTRVSGVGGDYSAVLPVQFQHEGSEAALYGRTSKVWRDYNSSYWYDETAKLLKVPGPGKSFEKNCMSCHAVGTQVTGSDTTNWTATTVTDPMWGDFDYDGDGLAEEMNLGCENCHGPGSEHWNSAGQGKFIVSPSLLTPERETMICGQCHSRPKGASGTDSPVNATGWMMRAGTSRHDFLQNFATTQLDGAASDFYADDDKHSKSHHQQYSDFIRSGMYKNGTQLMTCSTCHDPHEREFENQLRQDPSDDDALCGGACHDPEATDVAAHISDKLGTGLGTMMATAACVDCHMTETSKTGAGRPGAVINTTQYWTNDGRSHLFAVPDKAWSTTTGQNMPTPYTNTCGNGCHTSL